MALIEELFCSEAVNIIRDLYLENSNSTQLFYETFGHKILQSQEKILSSEPLSILMFICSTADFSSSVEESEQVAIIVYNRIKEKNPLPYFMDDKGLDLAEKCLVSLSFFYPAMVNRWKKGAPNPNFYRQQSKLAFESKGFFQIAVHHEKWERFFGEFFI